MATTDHPGAAVVLPMPPGAAVASALPGGLPAGELHLTLAYLPGVAHDDGAQFEALRAAVASWAAGLAPIAATLSGVGRFTGPAEDGDAVVLLADAPALAAPREALVAALTAAGFAVSTERGFNPHVTLAYVAAEEPTPVGRVGATAVTFEAVEVWRGATHDAVATLATLAPPAHEVAMHRRLHLLPLHFGAPVRLALAALAPTDAAGGPWTEIAYEVELKGYKTKAGHARITAADIDAMVKNFARYPKVPIVVEHADTREGMPTEWAEPRGWVVGLRRGSRERTVGGKTFTVATLEAQLSASDEVRLQIVGDVEAGVPPTWPFCSITPASGRDDETGEDLGAVLWSVSLTAHPRLADLPRLAASRRPTAMKNRTRGAQPGAVAPATPEPEAELGYWGSEIKTRGDVLSMLRSVFDLPVLTVEADVVAKLATLESLSASPEDASGVDVDSIVGELRRALGLDALKTTAEVIAAVRQALASLPAGDAPASAEMSRAQPRAANPAPPTEKPMKKTFLELAAELRAPAATEEAAADAVFSLARDGAAVRSALKVDADAPLAPALAAVAEERAELGKVRLELSKVSAERDAARAEIKAAADAAAKAEAERAERELTEHVDVVALAKGWDDDTKALVLAGARAAPDAFRAKHPKPSALELGQRAQDPARLDRIEFGSGRQPPPPAANNAPEAAASGPVELAARFQRIAAAAGQELDDIDALLLSGRTTPEAYARTLGVQLAG